MEADRPRTVARLARTTLNWAQTFGLPKGKVSARQFHDNASSGDGNNNSNSSSNNNNGRPLGGPNGLLAV